MRYFRYIILGAGPSGLTMAHALTDRLGSGEVLLIEREPVVGGLCRSEEVDGAPIEIGGGHFLDTTNKEALEFLFQFMPRIHWKSHNRISRIRLRGQEIDYPLEANLWKLSKPDQVDYLESVAEAGCVRGEPTPDTFSDWIVWKLGDRIARDYMLPYNRKIWSTDLSELGTYWLYKLPNVSFREMLRSCLEHRALGTMPAHTKFLYPKASGYGEVWRRIGEALGETLVTNCSIETIDLGTHTVNGCWRAETIINTIPWTHWISFCEVPTPIREDIGKLRYCSIDIDYVADILANRSHWIYEPDESIAYHRILLRSNFCAGSRGYWTETNSARSESAVGWRYHNEFAYPVNTRDKPEVLERILQWAANHGIVGIGRWGKWEHMNSDIAVAEALRIASNLLNNEA